MTYDEAMAIVSDTVAVYPFCMDNFHIKNGVHFFYKKKNGELTTFYNNPFFKEDPATILMKEYDAEWHIYEPATTTCLKCLGKGYSENKLSRLLGVPFAGIYACILNKEPKCKTCSNKCLLKSKTKEGLQLFGLIGDTLRSIGSGFYIVLCPDCIENKHAICYPHNFKIEELNIYQKETEVKEQYNLTWEEAKLAMERGAICEDYPDSYRYKIVGNLVFHSTDSSKNFIHMLDFKDCEKLNFSARKWKIIELIECSIFEVSDLFPSFMKFACRTHHRVSSSIEAVKDYCICKFIKKLKYDLEESKKMEKCQCQVNTYKVSEFVSGKCYKDINNMDRSIIKANNPLFLTYSFFINSSWVFPAHFSEVGLTRQLINEATYIEVDDPEKKEPEKKLGNGLGLSKEDLWPTKRANYCGIERTNLYAKSSEISLYWQKAIGTFVKLKSHPLAVKVTNERQFNINFDFDSKRIFVFSACSADGKITVLSPCFNSEKDAEKAIENIGKVNIINMFNTFAGIYD